MQEAITAVDVLRRAREILTPGGRWYQGWFKSPGEQAYCAIGAIIVAGEELLGSGEDARVLDAMERLEDETPGVAIDRIAAWNDADERTHEEVLRLFDQTIGGK